MKKNGALIFIKAAGLRHIRAAIYAWFFNFFLSLIVYWGLYRLFAITAGDSVIAGDIYGQTGLFTFLMDIMQNHKGSLGLIFCISMITAFLYFLTSIFLAGGIYSVLVGSERATFANLLSSSMENVFKMIKMFLVNLINWIVAAIIPVLLLIIFSGNNSLSQNETAIPIFFYIWIAITLFIMTFSTAIYDFSRIFKLQDDRGVFSTFLRAIKFTFSNKGSILTIFVLYGVTLFILYLFHTLLLDIIGSLLFPILLFCFFQFFMLIRYYLKLTVMKAEVKLTPSPAEEA